MGDKVRLQTWVFDLFIVLKKFLAKCYHASFVISHVKLKLRLKFCDKIKGQFFTNDIVKPLVRPPRYYQHFFRGTKGQSVTFLFEEPL